jgi:hypothetical protein
MNLAGSCSIRLLCQLLHVARSWLYYLPQPVPDAEAVLKAALLGLARRVAYLRLSLPADE